MLHCTTIPPAFFSVVLPTKQSNKTVRLCSMFTPMIWNMCNGNPTWTENIAKFIFQYYSTTCSICFLLHSVSTWHSKTIMCATLGLKARLDFFELRLCLYFSFDIFDLNFQYHCVHVFTLNSTFTNPSFTRSCLLIHCFSPGSLSNRAHSKNLCIWSSSMYVLPDMLDMYKYMLKKLDQRILTRNALLYLLC